MRTLPHEAFVPAFLHAAPQSGEEGETRRRRRHSENGERGPQRAPPQVAQRNSEESHSRFLPIASVACQPLFTGGARRRAPPPPFAAPLRCCCRSQRGTERMTIRASVRGN